MNPTNPYGALLDCAQFKQALSPAIARIENPLSPASIGAIPGTNLSAWSAITLASTAASAYHGYARSGGDPAMTIVWGALGYIFPVITPVVALYQGFGERR